MPRGPKRRSGPVEPTKLGTYLRKLRYLAGMSLRDVQNATGISNAYLSQVETGDCKNPTVKILRKLAEAYGVPLTSILEEGGYLDEKMDRPVQLSQGRKVMILKSLGNLSEPQLKEVQDFIEFKRLYVASR